MPRVNRVLKARKDQGTCSCCGDKISIGTTYVWWKFRFGGRYVRCGKPDCYPKPSDLTRSEYLGAVADFQNRDRPEPTKDDFESELEDIRSELEILRDEQEEKRGNMPESLQESDTGQLLQERYDNCDSAISELDSIDLSPLDEEPEPERKKRESEKKFEERLDAWNQSQEEKADAIWDEVISALSNL